MSTFFITAALFCAAAVPAFGYHYLPSGPLTIGSEEAITGGQTWACTEDVASVVLEITETNTQVAGIKMNNECTLFNGSFTVDGLYRATVDAIGQPVSFVRITTADGKSTLIFLWGPSATGMLNADGTPATATELQQP